MSIASTPPQKMNRPPNGLAVRQTRYDEVASMIITMLIVVGLIVFCMFIAWLGSRVFVQRLAVEAPLQQVGGGITDGFVGESMELNSPTWQDVAAESDIVEPVFQDQVAAVLDAVAVREADVADPFDTEVLEAGRGGTRQKGTGTRPGKGRGEGWPGIPPEDRWEIKFDEGSTLDVYAKQLDFFEIELGVISEGNQIDLVTKVSLSRPVVAQVTKDDRKLTLHFKQAAGRLREADRELVQKAGVSPGRRQIVHFYNANTEQVLLRREQDFRGIPASRIKKTVFRVIKAGGGYDFEVIEQRELL